MIRDAETTAPVTSGPSPEVSDVNARRGRWLLAAAGTAVSGAALVFMAVTSIVAAFSGSASTTTRAVTEAIMLLVLAGGVALLVTGLLKRRPVVKTPTLLWNAMLVPIGFSLLDGGAALLGVVTIVIAVVTFVVTLTLPRYELDEVAGADDVL